MYLTHHELDSAKVCILTRPENSESTESDQGRLQSAAVPNTEQTPQVTIDQSPHPCGNNVVICFVQDQVIKIMSRSRNCC